MISDTPRMQSALLDHPDAGFAKIWQVGCDIERELTTAQEHIKRLQAVTNDPHALWANWLRGSVTLPVGIGDVRQYQDRIKLLEEAGDALANNHNPFTFIDWTKAKEDK
jgi:hypothetical protein